MRHAKRLGQHSWWNAVPMFLVAGGFAVIGIAGDTSHRSDVRALEGMPSKDGGGDADVEAASDAPPGPGANRVRSHEAEKAASLEEGRAIVRHLPDESRRDAKER